jgi:hypothetical protein
MGDIDFVAGYGDRIATGHAIHTGSMSAAMP